MPIKDEGGESMTSRETSPVVQARWKWKEKRKEGWVGEASFFKFFQNAKCLPGQRGVPEHPLAIERHPGLGRKALVIYCHQSLTWRSMTWGELSSGSIREKLEDVSPPHSHCWLNYLTFLGLSFLTLLKGDGNNYLPGLSGGLNEFMFAKGFRTMLGTQQAQYVSAHCHYYPKWK